MARQSNGSLIVEPDDIGLFTAADLSRTEAARQHYEEISTGMITKMPTVREFLTDFQGQASPKTESNRRRAFKSFLTWMDEHSDKKADRGSVLPHNR